MKNDNLIFIDIETVGQKAEYGQVSPQMQKLREKKNARTCEQKDIDPGKLYNEKAGIFAEFGKIVCIVIGRIGSNNGDIVTKTFAGDDEKTLLTQFADTIRDRGQNYIFVGHNILEFDLPYIGRRMLVNHVPVPSILQLQNKKPWEILHIDTMNMWKFGDRKSFVSLDLLAAIFDIPTSKDDIDGSEVHKVYHEEKNLQRICTYCEKDVQVTAQVYFALCGQTK